MRVLLVRLAFSLALAALLALPVATASAQEMPGPTLVVENPNPGDMLPLGKLEMQGVAYDASATTGAGVDRVSVFLDNRDEGGMFLGDATLGAPNTITLEPAHIADAGWTLVTPALKGVGDGHSLFVYARSAVTGDETIVKIPVTIGDTAHPTGAGADEVVLPGVNEPEPGGGGGPADTSDANA
jgi:hypothetical protein